ncbi:YqcI/YcgG family protein [Priestia sp. BR_2]
MSGLIRLDGMGAAYGLPEEWQREAIVKLTEKMTDRSAKFPCIPAVQGHALNHFRYGFINRGESQEAAGQLAALLHEFVLGSRGFGPYTSLVVFINTEHGRDSLEGVEYYERLFWQLLSRTTEYDTEPWPADLPGEPDDHLWEFCYAGEPYFVYCGTPAHELRQSRYFPYMMLAFTPRWVLKQFNARARQAEHTKVLIRKRLTEYDPIPPHPDLKFYGAEDNYEWKQYFLRDNEESLSKCPFARLHKETHK